MKDDRVYFCTDDYLTTTTLKRNGELVPIKVPEDLETLMFFLHLEGVPPECSRHTFVSGHMMARYNGSMFSVHQGDVFNISLLKLPHLEETRKALQHN